MSFRADTILEKMEQRDPDFRYMAVSDLYNECQKESFKIDASSETKIVAKILSIITTDSSGDVKGIAVKCLEPLSKKVSEKELTVLVDGLRDNILGLNKVTPETMDISSVAMKSIVTHCPDAMKSMIIKSLAEKLTTEIAKSSSGDSVLFSLDVINDLLARWGREMATDGNLEKLKNASLSHLTSENSRARKKAIGCLGYLAVFLPDNLLNSLVESLIKDCGKPKKPEHARTFLQALAVVSRAVGNRLASHISKILPLVFKYSAEDLEGYENDEEIKDNCFQCLESLLLRCPKETDKKYEDVENLCIKYVSWDPFLIVVDGDDEEGGAMIEDDDFAALDDQEPEMADDDMS